MIPTVGFNMRKVSKGNVTIKVHIICDSERVCEGGGGCTVVYVKGGRVYCGVCM